MSNNKPMAAGTFSRKALPTNYKGISFKSRSEAFWAVFFDACGVDWRYEAQGYNMGGVNYLPDFYLRDVIVRQNGDGDGEDLYVEVKGNMFGDDLEKIIKFAGDVRNDIDAIFQNPILVVPSVPYGDTMTERERDAYRRCDETVRRKIPNVPQDAPEGSKRRHLWRCGDVTVRQYFQNDKAVTGTSHGTDGTGVHRGLWSPNDRQNAGLRESTYADCTECYRAELRCFRA